MTTDEAKRARWCPTCRWVTADDADGSLTPARAARKYPCEACLFGLNGDGWSSPESDPQALRYELDGCRAEIERLRHEAIIAEQSERLTRRSLESEIEHKAAEIERLRDLGLELLGAGRGLYDYVQAVDAYDPTDGLARWDAVDARCTAPSRVLGESGEGT